MERALPMLEESWQSLRDTEQVSVETFQPHSCLSACSFLHGKMTALVRAKWALQA